jgi:hypothetical protein
MEMSARGTVSDSRVVVGLMMLFDFACPAPGGDSFACPA